MNIELLKQQAKEAQELLTAPKRLQEALAEQARQKALSDATEEATKLQSDLDSKTQAYKIELEEVSQEFFTLLNQLYTLEQKYTKLGNEADSIMSLAYRLSQVECRAGYHTELARSQGLTSFDKYFLEGLAAEKITKVFSQQNPLYFNFTGVRLADLGSWLLNAPFFKEIKLQVLGQMSPSKKEVTQIIEQVPVVENEAKTFSMAEFQKLFMK